MTERAPFRVLFAGGGTGGHLFPALAIADRLTELLAVRTHLEIRFAGTVRGIEYRLRDQLGYPLTLISMRGIARRFSLKNLLVPFAVVRSLYQSHQLIRTFRPNLVVGTGGYVAWPVLRAGIAMGVPVVLQEQNSLPGIVTRQLFARAAMTYLGFASARAHLADGAQTMVTGNPVRTKLSGGTREEAIALFGLDPAKQTIAILGGSQGARAINQAILASMAKSSLPQNTQLVWQTGRRDYTDVAGQAGDTVSPRALFPFTDRMDLVYAGADVVIARAGALTIAELALAAVPSLLVPYPYAAGNHQQYNAESYAALGGCEVIPETELVSCDIIQRASELVRSGRSATMRESLRRESVSQRPAVDLICDDIISRFVTTGSKG